MAPLLPHHPSAQKSLDLKVKDQIMMEKTCTKLTGAARLARVLKVEGYSAATAMCTATNTRTVFDGCIKSRWNVGGYEWETSLYPATLVFGTGYDEPRFTKDAKPKTWKEKMAWDNTKWVAVKLVYLGEPLTRNLKVSLGCRLVDPMAIREPLEEKHVSRVFQGRGECSPPVVIKLIERRDLEASRYLRGDCLALQCTITVLEELPVATFPPMEVHVKVPPSNLRQNLLELLRRGTGADVTFLVSGETFAAHKNILASRSAVFMAEFFGGMKEKCSQQVEVKDMEAAVFKAMLDFIYTDDAPEFDEEKGVVTAMAQHLLAAADRYRLERLKLICEVKLSRGISVHTAATTLALAEQHHCSQLKAQCVKFILSTPAIRDAVLATEGYKHLAISCPSVMIDLLKSAHGTGRKI